MNTIEFPQQKELETTISSFRLFKDICSLLAGGKYICLVLTRPKITIQVIKLILL
jgi:hypothetical protein